MRVWRQSNADAKGAMQTYQLADVSPDAERVQNEGFVLQSRAIALQVIDQLKLRDNPEFNPALRAGSTQPITDRNQGSTKTR